LQRASKVEHKKNALRTRAYAGFGKKATKRSSKFSGCCACFLEVKLCHHLSMFMAVGPTSGALAAPVQPCNTLLLLLPPACSVQACNFYGWLQRKLHCPPAVVCVLRNMPDPVRASEKAW
jgi:hypothetical protein